MTEKLAATDPGSVARIFDWLRRFGGAAVFAVGVIVLLALARHLARDIDYHALLMAVRHMSNTALGEPILATLVSFLALIGRDVLALAQARLRPPASAVILAGFCGTALGNAVGFGTLTGGAVRYRIYGAVGVKPDQIGRVMVFIAAGFGLGLLGFTSAMVLVDSRVSALLLRWPVGMLRDVAVAGLVLTGIAVWLCAKGRLKLGRLSIDMPMPTLLVGQILLTGIDLIAAAAALWVLLPTAQIDFVGFTVVFSVATAMGVISHIPGGLGVFEAVVAFALGRNIPPDHIAAALLAYRGIYFVLPLLLSALLLAAFELRLRAMAVQSAAGLRLARSAARLTPVFVAVITFVAGIMLVVSGATPSFNHRLVALSTYVPLWVVEVSHFVGSLTGVLLLFIARGLLHRLDGAWFMALVLSIASLGLSMAKGLAYGEIAVFSLLILLLLMTRRQFHRPATLMEQAFTVGWFVAVGIIVASSFWILHFAFQDLHYSRDLLWQFEFDAQAPRAVRATVGVAILALSLALLQLLRPPKGFAAAPTADDLGRAEAILRKQNDSAGYLALMGDKSLMFSGSGQAFLMFARRGRSWIALFDPVGPRAEATELIWRFVELAASHGGRAAFYQVRPETLPLYLDAGLKIMKLGEEAVVRLDRFSLSGPKQAKLRYALSRGERDGLSVTLYQPDQVGPLLPVLETISTDWLKARRVSERGFSVASFKESFVAKQWVALLQQHNRPVAFVTVMTTETRQRATLGLMRHVSDASPYAMEFLFARLLLAFKEAGFHELSLGMAPLSGIEAAPLSSRWHRVGALLHRHGGFIYNFQGLRLFKSKFSPVWEPRGGVRNSVAVLRAGRRGGTGRRRQGNIRLNRIRSSLLALTLLATAPAWALDGGRYGEVRLIQPQGAMRGFVLFFSDRGGWTDIDQASVDALAAAGALVVGIDTDAYLSKIAPGDRACDQLVGDAEGISRQLQRQYGHIDYQFPILVGVGQGGTLAAATLAQAPANTLSGAVSIDPAATLASHRPLCAGQPAEPVGSDAFRYGPASMLNGFWTVGFSDAASKADRDHVNSLQQAGMRVTLSPVVSGGIPDAIVSDVQPHLYQGDPDGVEALPLVELPAESLSGLMAVVISGDGGWRDLDRTIAEALQKDGVSVIGWDSVRYFWHLKTPDETAADLAAVLTKYGEQWHAKKIALIGYSFGADVLPFLYNRLPPPLRAKIALVSLLGFTPKADWQISVSGWLGSPPSADALPVEADLGRMPPGLIQCFYGKEETDSFCPELAARGIDVIATEGGHHFDHDYAALEQRILTKFKQR